LEAAANGPSYGPDQSHLKARLAEYDAAVIGRLDSLHQEMKGGGITVGGVTFSGHGLGPHPYASKHLSVCWGHGLRHHVPNIRGSSPPGGHDEARGARGARQADSNAIGSSSLGSPFAPVQRDAKFDFLALKTYKQWKTVNGEGTSKLLKEGVERSFGLIKNAINSTFGMKPQARAVLSDLLAEFKMMFQELFVMEVNLFYEETLNKVGGEHPSDASKVQCWALVTKLLRTVFNATHGVRSFATEAGGPTMDPLQTNGYFLYAALEELRVLKEFSKVKWRRHEEFGHTMLGFVFENSVLDARPNPILS
jgi:hypothetical protein